MSLLICHFSTVGFLCWAAEHPSSKYDFYFILAHTEFQFWSQGLLPGGSDFSVSASLRRNRVLIILCCTTSRLKTTIYYLLWLSGLTGLSWKTLVWDFPMALGRWQSELDSSEGLLELSIQDSSLSWLAKMCTVSCQQQGLWS